MLPEGSRWNVCILVLQRRNPTAAVELNHICGALLRGHNWTDSSHPYLHKETAQHKLPKYSRLNDYEKMNDKLKKKNKNKKK